LFSWNRHNQKPAADMKKIGPNLKGCSPQTETRADSCLAEKNRASSGPHQDARLPPERRSDQGHLSVLVAVGVDRFSAQAQTRQRGTWKGAVRNARCLACHSIGEGDQLQGGTFAANLTRVGEKDNFDYLVRWVS